MSELERAIEAERRRVRTGGLTARVAVLEVLLLALLEVLDDEHSVHPVHMRALASIEHAEMNP